MTVLRTIIVLTAALSLSLATTTSAQNCQPEWDTGFAQEGADSVTRLALFDDGSGMALYVSGPEIAGGIEVKSLAKWDGEQWYPVPTSTGEGWIGIIETLDVGSGPALYASTTFPGLGGVPVKNIAKWDGSKWSALGDGLDSRVRAITTFDFGSGPEIVAGGSFTHSGDRELNRVARWNGVEWAPLGLGLDNLVRALEVYDDGSGPALYASGRFDQTGDGKYVWNIAKWDGKEWVSVGGGLGESNFSPNVTALRTFDDGTGSALYAALNYTVDGGGTVAEILRWDGNAWSVVGDLSFSSASEMEIWNRGEGLDPVLLLSAKSVEFHGLIHQWDGTEWSVLGGNVIDYNPSTHAIMPWGNAIYVGRRLWRAIDISCNNIAKWEDDNWSVLGGNGLTRVEWGGSLNDMLVDSTIPGVEPSIYLSTDRVSNAGINAGGAIFNGIGRFDGEKWYSLGLGLDDDGRAIEIFDDGTGPRLYVVGRFDNAGGVPAKSIASWDGENWAPVGGGVSNSAYSLETYNLGTNSLYVGGGFNRAGNVNARRIARWDGTEWHALGSGIESGNAKHLIGFDDGIEPRLYAGGALVAGGHQTNGLAQWNGSEWSTVQGWEAGTINAFAIFDNSDGPALYVAGEDIVTQGKTNAVIARWDGTNWYSVGSDLGDPSQNAAYSLAVFDDLTGNGKALYAGGIFNSESQNTRYLLRLDGEQWNSVGNSEGVSGAVYNLVVDNGDVFSTPSLCMTGSFRYVDDIPSTNIAVWQACEPQTATLINYQLITGSHIDGDINSLIDSDNIYLHTQSGHGETIADLHNMEIAILAETQVDGISTLNLKIESHIDEPTGIAQIRMKNFNTTEFDLIHTYTIGSSDSVEWIPGIDAAIYHNTNNGRMRLKIKHFVFVPFLAFTFESFIDHVEIAVVE